VHFKAVSYTPNYFYNCTISNKNEKRMRTAYLFLEIARRLAAQWFCSRLCMTFPFLFSFCFCDDEGHGLLLGFFFFWFAGGRLKTMILVLVFWVYCLYWSLFYGFLSSVSPSFSFVPSLSVSLFCLLFSGRLCSAFIEPAAASVVVTVAPHPKCSVTDAFNEENVRVSCQRTKRLCL
jgi:hypothetical protein